MESKKIDEKPQENDKNIKLEELNVNFETIPDSINNNIIENNHKNLCNNNKCSSDNNNCSIFTYLDLLRYILQSLCNIIYYRFFDIVDDVYKIYDESVKKIQ